MQARARVIDDDPPPDERLRTPQWTEVFANDAGIEARAFREGESVWTVMEITSDYLDRFGLTPNSLVPELRSGWLSFECGEERRRYAPIPPDWHRMIASELQELCRRATPVRRDYSQG